MRTERPGEYWVRRGQGTFEIFPTPLEAAKLIVEQEIAPLREQVERLTMMVSAILAKLGAG